MIHQTKPSNLWSFSSKYFMMVVSEQYISQMLMICFYILISLGVLYFLYAYYLRPKYMCKYYVKLLTAMGYRVYEYPFKVVGVPIYEALQHYEKEHKDPLYEAKYSYQGYDVAVANMIDHPHLVFLNPKLAMGLITSDKAMILPKVSFLFKIFLQKFGEGLVFIEGERWRSRRKIISKAFTFDFLKELVPQIAEISDEIFDRMEMSNKAQGVHNKFRADLFKLGLELFSSVTVNGFMGMGAYLQKIDGKYVNQHALEVTELTMSCSIHPLVIIFGAWVYKLGIKKDFRMLQTKYNIWKEYSKRKLNEIKSNFQGMSPVQQKSSKNLIHSLLYQAKLNDSASNYTDEEIIQQIMTFTTAGSDTTSSLFSMSLLRIFQFPELQKNVRKQINDNFKNNSNFAFQNLKQLQLIDWIQLEVLRMHSPAQGIFDRLTTVDTLIGYVPVKTGTALNYFQTTAFYDERLFEEADKFKPERWKSKDQKIQQLMNLILMSFSGGPRSCIGKHLALLQSKIAIIKFLQRYQHLQELNERVFTISLAYHLKNNDVSFTKTQ